jgi:hypothetical protein
MRFAPFKGPFQAGRRVLEAVAALALAIGLASVGPAAHASGCSWQPLTLENGWQSDQSVYQTGDPAFCAESDGMVYLSGSLTRPAGASFAAFAVLPSYAAPAHCEYMSVYTYGGTNGVLRVWPDGSLFAYFGKASQFTSLAGVSFPAAGTATTGVMPLMNGWQSAQGTYDSGDPSYYVSNGAVHLDGSLLNPTPHVPFSNDEEFFAFPGGVAPPVGLAGCFERPVYTYGGGTALLWGDDFTGALGAPSTQFTSLAGVSYPSSGATYQSLTGSPVYDEPCIGASYTIISGVVYLSGSLQFSAGFVGQIGTLPAGARPTHVLYLIVGGDGAGGTTWVTLRVDPGGGVSVYNGGATTVYTGTSSFSGFNVYLQGIAFHTGS